MGFNKIVLLAVLSLALGSCSDKSEDTLVLNDYTKLVDPMIGTDWNGHTFPGATLPNGMVQLSPDTKTRTWNNCSGYHYKNESILGFSHTHYSGTGEGGGADILFMPTTGDIKLNSGEYINDNEDDYTLLPGSKKDKNLLEDTSNGYRSAFSHKNEYASPGYYSVLLDDYGVKVELTATTRVGMHKYTFPKSSESNIILDLVSGNSDVVDSLYLGVNGKEIYGYRAAMGALDGKNTVYFVARFSKPFESYGISVDGKINENLKEAKGEDVKSYFRFNTEEKESIILKVAISSVSIEGARKNLDKELPGWDFEKVRDDANVIWNKELNKIQVEGGSKEQQKVFYTSLYHALIHPNINMDVDNKYRSTNKKVYTAKGFDNYTTFSLWDSFRALHPLQSIINVDKTNQYIRTYIERYENSGSMPMMEFSGNEAATMIGYHSIPVVADAYAKGIRDYDINKAYEGIKHLSNAYREGKDAYLLYGFMPYDLYGQSVSRTLEYSYDDWCVSRMAVDLNDLDYQHYSQRGQFYHNLFDNKTNFMRPKSSEYKWMDNFNPMEISNRYTEGNAYQYSPSVFQDIDGLIKSVGGDEKFDKWLDEFFTVEIDTTLIHLPDVTGLIGQYAHGNEPSHHTAYLYNYVGKPWKTQEKIREILTTLYSTEVDGISGNEDTGQMSAWYVLSSMGFYSVTPGLDYYVIGSPLFDKVTINLENGKKFVIVAENNKIDNPYIQSVSLNGKPYTKSIIKHSDIVNGSTFVFKMGKEPNIEWASNKADRPQSIKYNSAPMPKAKTTGNIFLKSTKISLFNDNEDVVIRYTLDGSEPNETSKIYSKPFTVKETSVLKAKCFVKGLNPGYTLTINLNKVELTPALNVSNAKHGLSYEYKEGFGRKLAELDRYPILKTGVIKSFNLDAIKDARAFGYKYEGLVYVPKDGLYSFEIEANDGAILFVDGEELINNDGGHQSQAIAGKTGLKKGFHKIRLDYFQMGRAKKLTVKWSTTGLKKQDIPASALFHN